MTSTRTLTPTRTPTRTSTSTVNPSFSWTGTKTSTKTHTPVFTHTPTPTYSRTQTLSPTESFTGTYLTSTFTDTPTWTPTSTPTSTPTATLTPTTTSTGTVVCPLEYACGDDWMTGITGSGTVTFGFGSRDFVPLCNGWILVANRVSNQIQVFNVVTNSTAASYQMTASPNLMEYDKAGSFVYIGLDSASVLAKVDLANGTVTNIPLGAPTSVFCRGPSDMLFCKYSSGPTLALVDTHTNTVTTAYADFNANHMAFDWVHNRLFLGYYFALVAADFMPGPNTLSAAQTVENGYVDSLRISPDGNHLACAGMNRYMDYKTTDLHYTYGSWPGHHAGDFSPEGSEILCPYDSRWLRLYSVDTHVLSRSITVRNEYIPFHKARFSGGGRILYSFVPDDANAKLSWSVK